MPQVTYTVSDGNGAMDTATVIADRALQMVTISGEAGIGKSRMVYEFENWVDLQPQTMLLYRGRARQETRRLPYGLYHKPVCKARNCSRRVLRRVLLWRAALRAALGP